jgi:hypothetical protein
VQGAFNGRAPVHHGETLKEGFCGLCNRRREVTMRQWFVCGPCWNFILGYQKSIAATVGLRKWWKEKIEPSFPKLILHETEPVSLLPYARAKRTKMQRAEGLEVLDFLVSADSKNGSVKLFHIEQKAGPSSIDDMSVFQLDVNDFNDIAGAMNMTKIPAYVVHVQVKQEYAFPTRRTTVEGMWWTDIFAIQKSDYRIGPRRGEDKFAIYFEPSVFKHIDTFPAELRAKRYKTLTAKLLAKRVKLLASEALGRR